MLRRYCWCCGCWRRSVRLPLPLLLLLLVLILVLLLLMCSTSRPACRVSMRVDNSICGSSDSARTSLSANRDNADGGPLVNIDILMPAEAMAARASGSNSSSGSLDIYLCTSLSLASNSTLYIARFEPRGVAAAMRSGAEMRVHHMLLAACDQLPAHVGRQWNCGAMSAAEMSAAAPPPRDICASGLRYVYAYAMDAPALLLPEGVAFPVGGRFGGQHVVLQVHYTRHDHHWHAAKTPPLHHHQGGQHSATASTAGVRLGLLPGRAQPPKRLAGVHLSATGGLIPPRSVAHLSSGCPYTGDATLHPFAFRVHTHRLGRVVSVYRIRRGSSQRHQHELLWSLIGQANPQMMQAFYPVNNSGLQLAQGDYVAATCVMENPTSRLVRIGPTAGDEMCNAYVMYWYQLDSSSWDAESHVGDHGCFSKGRSDLWVEAPNWVNRQSATVPGTGTLLSPGNLAN